MSTHTVDVTKCQLTTSCIVTVPLRGLSKYTESYSTGRGEDLDKTQEQAWCNWLVDVSWGHGKSTGTPKFFDCKGRSNIQVLLNLTGQ